METKNGLRWLTGICSGLALLTGWFALSATPAVSTMSFLDVGQGDAVFLRTQDDVRMLIDGGPGENILRELPEVLPMLAGNRIDILILTHPDADHLEGLIPVLKRYQVQKVITSGDKKDTAAFREFEEAVPPGTHLTAKAGDKIKFPDGSSFQFIWPAVLSGTKTNEMSLVGKYTHGTQSVLLTGDIGAPTESELLRLIQEEYLAATVLKVGHHGSRYSSSADFLNKVNASLGIIMVGENSYGHPTQEAMARLRAARTQVLRTDTAGRIELRFGNDPLTVMTEK